MQTFVVIYTSSIFLLAFGIALFVYYMRTRKRWAWALSVALMVVGILGMTMWG